MTEMFKPSRYLPYSRQKITNSDIKNINKVLKSDFITQGPTILEFEKKWSKWLGIRYSPFVSSGSSANYISISILKVLNKNKPSSEILLHSWIYRNHKDIKAVVHSHSKWASILSCMRISIPSFHYMVAEFGGNNIKCSKYATFGTEKLSKYVNEVLHKRKGCLIANHDLSIAVEKLSEQFYYLWITKQTKLLSDKEMRKIVKLFKDYKAKH